jgi:hypothetical protein
MKSKTLKLVIFLAGILIVISMGCKKTTSPEPNKNFATSSQNQKILNLIKDFKKTMHSSLKSGDEMTIDSTVWYLTATLNETYARTDSTKKIIYEDSAFVALPITPDGTVTMENINTAYSQMVERVRDFYHSFSGDKSLLLVDLFVKSVDNDQLIIKMVYEIAKPEPYDIWFGTTDTWHWGLKEGRCDGAYFTIYDAALQLAIHANWNIINQTPPGCFYADFTHVTMIYPGQVPLPLGVHNPYGYGDNYLYYNTGTSYPEPHECLSPEIMNYYLSNLFVIASLFQPRGKFVSNYDCKSDITVENGVWTHVHWLNLTYGILAAPNDPPEQL